MGWVTIKRGNKTIQTSLIKLVTRKFTYHCGEMPMRNGTFEFYTRHDTNWFKKTITKPYGVEKYVGCDGGVQNRNN